MVSCSTYHYRVRSIDSLAYERIDSDHTFTTTGCTGSAGVVSQTASEVTTDLGGTVSLLSNSKGITLVVPADYSDLDAEFQIKQLSPTSVIHATSTPSGYALVGSYLYDLKALTDLSTTIPTFDNALSVTMSYGTSDISNFIEGSLKIYRWDGSSWTVLSDCVVDTAANTVTCSTTHFSVFGVFGHAKPVVVVKSRTDTSDSSSSPDTSDSGTSDNGSQDTQNTSDPTIIVSKPDVTAATNKAVSDSQSSSVAIVIVIASALLVLLFVIVRKKKSR
jgi:hypothetical protein